MKIQRCGPNLFYVDLSLPTTPGRGQRMRAVVDHLRCVWPDARVTAGAGTLMVEGALTESNCRGSTVPDAHQDPAARCQPSR